MEELSSRSFQPCYSKIIAHLERTVTPARFQHSLRVADMLRRATEESYSIDQDSAIVAGLLHDVAKDLSCKKMLGLIKRFNGYAFWDLPPSCRGHEMYLHGPAGAVIARRSLRVCDHSILRAITTHTGCYPDMGPLARMLHIADFAEPGRDVPERDEVERLLFLKDLDSAELIIARWIVRDFPSMDIPLHPFYGQKILNLSRSPTV